METRITEAGNNIGVGFFILDGVHDEARDLGNMAVRFDAGRAIVEGDAVDDGSTVETEAVESL